MKEYPAEEPQIIGENIFSAMCLLEGKRLPAAVREYCDKFLTILKVSYNRRQKGFLTTKEGCPTIFDCGTLCLLASDSLSVSLSHCLTVLLWWFFDFFLEMYTIDLWFSFHFGHQLFVLYRMSWVPSRGSTGNVVNGGSVVCQMVIRRCWFDYFFLEFCLFADFSFCVLRTVTVRHVEHVRMV